MRFPTIDFCAPCANLVSQYLKHSVYLLAPYKVKLRIGSHMACILVMINEASQALWLLAAVGLRSLEDQRLRTTYSQRSDELHLRRRTIDIGLVFLRLSQF